MYRLYGFLTQNSMKPLYVMTAVGAEFDFQFINLLKGENRNPEFADKTPVGKVPVLEHDGEYLLESGAICRYVANTENSPLYPDNPLERARVDQWLDYFAHHPGRWLSTLFFQKIVKPMVGLGETDEAACEEADKYAHQQCAVADQHLQASDWLANDALSIADLAGFAYIEQCRYIDFPLHEYPNLEGWHDRIERMDSTQAARDLLPINLFAED